MAMTSWPIPRAAYVHIPFCRHHCGYCNFTVITSRPELQVAYVDALALELSALEVPRQVDTLYLGGGTPTELTPTHLSRCLKLCRDWFLLAEEGEFTVEANPEDIDRDLLKRLVDGGVNRISLGVQSFDDQKLSALQRQHTGQMAKQAVELAAEYVPNVSIDLIFAAPLESVGLWHQDLSAAMALPLQHLSTYGLTYEKGSAFYGRLQRGSLEEIDEEHQLQMYGLTQQLLASHGFVQYEVSNFSKAGFESRHNLAYWEGRGWYAAGAGAARFERGAREVNHRSTTTYIRRLQQGATPVAERDELTVEEWAFERVGFGLRRLQGVDLMRVREETGVAVEALLKPLLERYVSLQLIHAEDGFIRLSERGLLVSDTIVSEILRTRNSPLS